MKRYNSKIDCSVCSEAIIKVPLYCGVSHFHNVQFKFKHSEMFSLFNNLFSEILVNIEQ